MATESAKEKLCTQDINDGDASSDDPVSLLRNWRFFAATAAAVFLSEVARRLPPVIGVIVLAVGIPSLLCGACQLWPLIQEGLKGRSAAVKDASGEAEPSLESLRPSLEATRNETAEMEERRRCAVEGTTQDRDQLYRLNGELAALNSSKDRVLFLKYRNGTSTDSSTSHEHSVEERARLSRENLQACRECEERRLSVEAKVAEATELQERVRQLEAEIESTLQRREKEETNRSSLDEETTKLRAQISRLRAKVTEHDTRLIHARQELKLRGGSVDVDRRRMELDVAASLQEKRREVKNEEQQLRRTQGEKRFVQTVGDNLRSLLEQRTQEIKDLKERLERQEAKSLTTREAIKSKQDQIKELNSKKVAGRDVEGCLTADNQQVPAKSKTKAGKQAKGKRRKDTDGLESSELEDLELELAGMVAAREAAEQRAAAAKAAADARMSAAQRQIGKVESECGKVSKQLEAVRRDHAGIDADRAKMEKALAERSDVVKELEAKVKDAERDKIRLRLDIRRAQDAKLEVASAHPSTSTSMPAETSSSASGTATPSVMPAAQPGQNAQHLLVADHPHGMCEDNQEAGHISGTKEKDEPDPSGGKLEIAANAIVHEASSDINEELTLMATAMDKYHAQQCMMLNASTLDKADSAEDTVPAQSLPIEPGADMVLNDDTHTTTDALPESEIVDNNSCEEKADTSCPTSEETAAEKIEQPK